MCAFYPTPTHPSSHLNTDTSTHAHARTHITPHSHGGQADRPSADYHYFIMCDCRRSRLTYPWQPSCAVSALRDDLRSPQVQARNQHYITTAVPTAKITNPPYLGTHLHAHIPRTSHTTKCLPPPATSLLPSSTCNPTCCCLLPATPPPSPSTSQNPPVHNAVLMAVWISDYGSTIDVTLSCCYFTPLFDPAPLPV
jgi:hypothetical protein